MRRFDVEDEREGALLEAGHVDGIVPRIDAGRVAHDVDQAIEGVQAAEQVVVLAIAAGQKAGEVAEAHALEACRPVKTLERAGILRAYAVDQDLVELARLARAGDREAEHVPEREAEIIDQDLA